MKAKKILQVHRKVFFGFVTVVSMLTNAAFVRYFVELKHRGCPCASDWRNSTLVGLFTALLGISCLQVAGVIPHSNDWINYAVTALHVVTTAIGLSYMQKLQDIDCQTCTKSPLRFVLNMLLNFNAMSYILVAAAVLFQIIVWTILLRKHVRK